MQATLRTGLCTPLSTFEDFTIKKETKERVQVWPENLAFAQGLAVASSTGVHKGT